MRKKKLLSILVVTAMTAGVLVGCGGSQDGDDGSGGSTKKKHGSRNIYNGNQLYAGFLTT